MKLLVLYEELSGYFLSCIKAVVDHHEGEVLIYCRTSNPIAPFKIAELKNVKILDRGSLSLSEMKMQIETFAPEIILCGGWSYAPYRKIAKEWKGRIPVVLGFDNQWKGTLRQKILTFLARPMLRASFTHAWVPGQQQVKFAQKLGFADREIKRMAYCADTDTFGDYFQKHQLAKSRALPHRFIYSGRYSEEKNLVSMWKAFILALEETGSDWEFWCAGKGEIEPIQHPKIKHFGFIQPDGFSEMISGTSVFVLASSFEPWGVVVHEFATAGYPLLLSEQVGAKELFLQSNVNGFSFQSDDLIGMKRAFVKIMGMSDDSLREMGTHSLHLAATITPAIWAKTLINLKPLTRNSKSEDVRH